MTIARDRYSPLRQITPANASGLRQACAFDTPDSVSFQSGLVAVAGTLYFTAFNNTYAIDGATCRQKWNQKWKQSRAEPANFLQVNRGVAYAGGRLFRGTGDAHALALDAGSGKELWRDALGKPIGGGVISYEAGGKQRVAVAAGLNSPIWPVNGGKARVVIYALP